mmetsp:Transcript_3862/g.14359  ORF Transcript_3862/g.14359 Transcript_3862/m.14359 type:complete len:362 (-) Transcript_3862:1587-2672(-)
MSRPPPFGGLSAVCGLAGKHLRQKVPHPAALRLVVAMIHTLVCVELQITARLAQRLVSRGGPAVPLDGLVRQAVVHADGRAAVGPIGGPLRARQQVALRRDNAPQRCSFPSRRDVQRDATTLRGASQEDARGANFGHFLLQQCVDPPRGLIKGGLVRIVLFLPFSVREVVVPRPDAVPIVGRDGPQWRCGQHHLETGVGVVANRLSFILVVLIILVAVVLAFLALPIEVLGTTQIAAAIARKSVEVDQGDRVLCAMGPHDTVRFRIRPRPAAGRRIGPAAAAVAQAEACLQHSRCLIQTHKPTVRRMPCRRIVPRRQFLQPAIPESPARRHEGPCPANAEVYATWGQLGVQVLSSVGSLIQ